MEKIVVDINSIRKHLKKLDNKPIEFYLVEYYQYPYLDRSIDRFNVFLSEHFNVSIDKLDTVVNSGVYNIVVNSILSIIEIAINQKTLDYKTVRYSKTVEVTADKILVEFFIE